MPRYFILILVCGLVGIFYFPINIGFLIIPIDEVIFFRGVFPQPPTSIDRASKYLGRWGQYTHYNYRIMIWDCYRSFCGQTEVLAAAVYIPSTHHYIHYISLYKIISIIYIYTYIYIHPILHHYIHTYLLYVPIIHHSIHYISTTCPYYTPL